MVVSFMPVGSIGPETVITASPDDTVTHVATLLDEENVGSIVVTRENKPVGIVTDRDVARTVATTEDISSLAVEEIMSPDPVTLHEEDEAMAISRTIGESHVRRVPVVGDDGELTGIVTLDDLVATIGEQLDNVAETIESQSPEYRP